MRPSLPFVVPFTLLLCLSSLCSSIHGDLVRGFRPPAIPLINLSPNVAAWMRGTNLTDQTPTMWYDHANSTMTGYLRVDGTAYRFLGLDSVSSPFASTLKGQRGYRPGKDLPNSPVRLLGGQASDCALLCDATRDCRAWSWFPSDCGRGNASMCFLKAELQDAVSDSCAVSDVQAVYLPDASINGEPKRDRGGSDISDFSMPSGSQPHDCAMQCFLTIGCDAWAFAHDNCPDYGPEPHCWIKSAGTQSAPYPTDCRTSGTGPYSAGWVPPAPPATATLQQMDLVVTPTRTIAVFSGGGVALLLTFMQPSFPHDIATSAREHVYIDAQVISVDGGSHDVQLYIDVASDFVVNAGADHVVWSDVSAAVQKTLPNAHVLTMSPFNTVPFNVRGDENRANWGDAYFATDSVYYSGSTQAVAATARQAFVTGAPLPPSDTEQPRASDDRMVVSAFTFDLGTVGKTFVVATVVLYYDEVWPMYFFRQLMPSYSSHIYGSWSAYLVAALQDFGSLMEQAVLYDGVLIGSLGPVVGDRFSTLLALIHRQVMGSTLIVWDEQRQTPWVFLKEMSTGGAISTIDVVYPAAPFYVALAPEALRLMLLPMLAYSNNETNSHYNLPWAPHHLGAWPVCDILSSQQEQMPIEESGNFLIMLAAIAQRQLGAVDYLAPYWPVLETWAQYINISLPDPGEQLCTDDFEGPSPHNANLALKGIIGLNAYAVLLRYAGQNTRADAWDALAASLAKAWMSLAVDGASGPRHYKQRYDQNGTWSTKYNLIWQYVLGSSAFPDDVRVTENAYYQTKAEKYGIPLDNRHLYQKSDWFSWMGALAFDNATQQTTIIDYLYAFAHTSPSREPFTDLFDVTNNQAASGGFIARAVMGGLYSIVLTNAQAQAREAGKEGVGLEVLRDFMRFEPVKVAAATAQKASNTVYSAV